MVMTFYPETTVKEVMDSFHKMKQTTTDIYFDEYYSGKMPIYDTIKNITRDRHIYWLKKSGMSWSQVGRYVADNFEEVAPRALSKAYERYEAALNM
jgi:nucleoside-triphosphatase THEP1